MWNADGNSLGIGLLCETVHDDSSRRISVGAVSNQFQFEAGGEDRLMSIDAPVALRAEQPDEGIGICLSGGGYRAMLFHLGAVWRLCERGILGSARRISSVSGGSITAAVLATAWDRLGLSPDDGHRPIPESFRELVVEPIRRLASVTIDVAPSVRGFLCLGGAAEAISAKYDSYLFHGATLQDLPDNPRFVINATNLKSGVLWRFSKPYMADYTVGRIEYPNVRLATVVAASSAFPPLLSPLRLSLGGFQFADDAGERPRNAHERSEAVLTDGGVYDNMGLETVWKNFRSVFVSDAGGGADHWDARASRNWLRQLWRVFWIQRQQAAGLRRRQLIAMYRPKAMPGDSTDPWWRHGCYWSISTPCSAYGLSGAPLFPDKETSDLASIAVRLKAMPQRLQERIVQCGYAACDASLRRWFDPTIEQPACLPTLVYARNARRMHSV